MNPEPLSSGLDGLCATLAATLGELEKNVVTLEALPVTSMDRQALAREALGILDDKVLPVLTDETFALDFSPYVETTNDLRDRCRECIA